MTESGTMTTRITIVIPVRNDATALARLLDHLAGLRDVAASEIVVAAWGDPDGTERAVAGRARLIWPGGSTRASLMNAGAAVAVPGAPRAVASPPAGHGGRSSSSSGCSRSTRWAWTRSGTPSAGAGLPTALRECRGPPVYGLGPTLIAEGPSAEARLEPPAVEAKAPTDPADRTLPDTRETQTLPELTRRRRSS